MNVRCYVRSVWWCARSSCCCTPPIGSPSLLPSLPTAHNFSLLFVCVMKCVMRYEESRRSSLVASLEFIKLRLFSSFIDEHMSSSIWGADRQTVKINQPSLSLSLPERGAYVVSSASIRFVPYRFLFSSPSSSSSSSSSPFHTRYDMRQRFSDMFSTKQKRIKREDPTVYSVTQS